LLLPRIGNLQDAYIVRQRYGWFLIA
jgi:hypothetical protein